MKLTDTSDLAAVIEAAYLQERIMTVLLTLAGEYEARAIDKDRFAKRCFETLHGYADVLQKKRSPDAASGEQPEGKK